MKKIRIALICLFLLILAVLFWLRGGENINRTEYILSDIVEYNQEYGVYYTTDTMFEYLTEQIYIDGYIHRSEDGSYSLVNIPYLDDYSNLGRYGIISIPIKGRPLSKENIYVRCLSKVVQTDDGLVLEIYSVHNIEEKLNTKQEEFKTFLKSGNFSDVIDCIEDIAAIEEMDEYERQSKVKTLLTVQSDLEDNFYQETGELLSIIKYLAYVYSNPQISKEKDINSIEEAFIYYTLQWGLS